MQGIKNIIFDLGAVILNIDYQLTQKAFEKLGLPASSAFYSKQAQHDLFDQLETGKIHQAEFVQAIQLMLPNTTSEQQIIEAWNAIILDFPLRRLQILQQLQLHFNLFLLSNTNEIHERKYNEVLRQQCGYPTLALFFDKVYLSHRVGLRKPNPEIFTLVLTENNLRPEETLFIDDSIQHIGSAAGLGIQTIHMKDGMTMEDDIFKPKTAI